MTTIIRKVLEFKLSGVEISLSRDITNIKNEFIFVVDGTALYIAADEVEETLNEMLAFVKNERVNSVPVTVDDDEIKIGDTVKYRDEPGVFTVDGPAFYDDDGVLMMRCRDGGSAWDATVAKLEKVASA